MLCDLFHTCPLQKMLRELALGLIWMMTSCPERHSKILLEEEKMFNVANHEGNENEKPQ